MSGKRGAPLLRLAMPVVLAVVTTIVHAHSAGAASVAVAAPMQVQAAWPCVTSPCLYPMTAVVNGDFRGPATYTAGSWTTCPDGGGICPPPPPPDSLVFGGTVAGTDWNGLPYGVVFPDPRQALPVANMSVNFWGYCGGLLGGTIGEGIAEGGYWPGYAAYNELHQEGLFDLEFTGAVHLRFWFNGEVLDDGAAVATTVTAAEFDAQATDSNWYLIARTQIGTMGAMAATIAAPPNDCGTAFTGPMSGAVHVPGP